MIEIVKGNKTALLFGATGLVGSFCLQQLLAHPAYSRVIAFTRRPLKVKHAKLEEQIVNFDQPDTFSHLIKGDDLYICIGTTMAKAGSKAAFYKVDFTYCFQAAKAASINKVNQLLLVTAVGANRDSFFFYNRVKGDLEEAVKALPFWATHIFQPSALLGERNENRWGEEVAGAIGKVFDRLTGGLLTKYRPVEAEVVAQAMISAAQGLQGGTRVYPSHYLQDLANTTDVKRLV